MLLPVPESMYPWVMMILMALLIAPVEFASPCSHSARYHRVAFQTRIRYAPRASLGCSMRGYDYSYSRGGPHVYTREDRAGARSGSRGSRVQPAKRPGRPAQVEHEDTAGTGRGRLLQAGRRRGRRVLQGAGRERGGDQPRCRLGGRHRNRRAYRGPQLRQGVGAEILRALRLRQGYEPPVGALGEGSETGRL